MWANFKLRNYLTRSDNKNPQKNVKTTDFKADTEARVRPPANVLVKRPPY